MTDEERLHRVASLMTRRASTGALLNVRADRRTRLAMSASCAASLLGCGWLVGANDPSRVAPAVSRQHPAVSSDGDIRTPSASTSSSSVPPAPPSAVLDEPGDADITYGTAVQVLSPEPGEDLDALTGGS